MTTTGSGIRVLEGYLLGSPIASGGMSTVYLARPMRLPRVVAMKQLAPALAADPALVRMFEDEIQLLSRVRHTNVVAPIDQLRVEREFFLVMEYVEGEALSKLTSAGGDTVRPTLVSKIMVDVLRGLDAAHCARDPRGEPINIVHRDVSPHNILVGTDGVARLVDFGIATALWRAHVTQPGQLKGKAGYMAPEHLRGEPLDQRADIYAAGIVLWELLTGQRLFTGNRSPVADSPEKIEPPSTWRHELSPEVDALVLRALAPNPANRFRDASELAEALIRAIPPASVLECGHWVRRHARIELEWRRSRAAELETYPIDSRGEGTAGPPDATARKPPVADADTTRDARVRMMLVVAGLLALLAFGARWLAPNAVSSRSAQPAAAHAGACSEGHGGAASCATPSGAQPGADAPLPEGAPGSIAIDTSRTASNIAMPQAVPRHVKRRGSVRAEPARSKPDVEGSVQPSSEPVLPLRPAYDPLQDPRRR